MTTDHLPLAHLKVLDLSRAVSGPFAGRILSDLGADVVKVEPPAGDLADAFGSKQGGRSGLFAQMNAGKRNIRLDLQEEPGITCTRALAAECDVVIENYRPGVLDRLGLGYDMLRRANPALVMLSISGFGRVGPETGRRAYAPVVHAESGALVRQARQDGREPGDFALALADTFAGLHGVIALLAALTLRDRTGQGQHIDLSMIDAMVASDDYAHEVLDGAPTSGGRGTVWDAVGGPILIAADVRSAWAALKPFAGLVDGVVASDSLETKIAARRGLIAGWLRSFVSRPALLRGLDDAGIAWAEVRSPEDVLDEASFVDRPPYEVVDDGGGGHRRVVRMPYRFSDAGCRIAGRVAGPDADRDAVLHDWLADATSEDRQAAD